MDELKICMKCGINDSAEGWCPDCQKCWDCMEECCKGKNTKPSYKTDSEVKNG